MAMKIDELLFTHSGGAANTSPAADFGGIISSAGAARIKSQTLSTPVNVTGVTIVDAYGNAEGVGTLTYINATDFLGWRPYGGATTNGVIVTTNGTYVLGTSAGYLVVTVVFASLPVIDKSDSLTLANELQNVFPNVDASQSLQGLTTYRGVYIRNSNAVDTAVDVKVWIRSNTPAGDNIDIGLDPAGKGNGTSSGVMAVIANGTTAPAGVTFSNPTSYAGGLSIGNLLPLQVIGLWQRRIVPVETRGTVISNNAQISLAATI